MAKFDVDVSGVTYEVEAPDEQTAWHWANATHAKAGVRKREYDPTEGMSVSEKALAGVGKAFADIGRGLGQYVGLVSPEDIAEARRLDAPLMATTAGRLGNIGGNVAIAAPTAMLPGANTVAGAGLYGALYGAAQPAETGAERLGNVGLGGVGGAVVTGAMRTLPALKRALIDPFTGRGQERIVSDVLRRFGGDSLPAEMQRSIIPGYERTLAEATRNVGLSQLERSAQSASQDTAKALGERQLANNRAVVDALERMAGSERDRALMRGVREMMSGPLYKQAKKEGVDTAMADALKPQIESLLSRPSVQKASSLAKDLARENGIALDDMGSVQGLHYLKLAIDDMLDGAKASGLGRAQQRALTQTKADLLSVIDELSQTYAQARTGYASWSRPINQMEVAQSLLEKVRPALAEFGGAPRMTPATYANALRNAEQTVRGATGFAQPLEQLMSASQMGQLTGIAEDLGRRAFAQEAGRVAGSPTAQYLAGGNALRSLLGPLGLPQSWSDTLLAQALANRWISAAAKPAETRLQETLARALIEPEYAQMLLTQPAAPLSGLLSNAGRYLLPPVAIGSVNAAKQ